jgi:uncharacterized protein
MPAFFFDSSALGKCYFNEVGSAWTRILIAPASGNDIHVLRIAEVEVTSAIVRRQRGGAISAEAAAAGLDQLQHDLANEFLLLELSGQLFVAAVSLVHKHGLRAYDAVQLAGALELSRVRSSGQLSPLTIVCADQELNAAAQTEGLAVEDPNDHP